MNEEFKNRAQQYICGVYCGQPSVVDALAGKNIVLSYPVFEQLFNTSTFFGRKGVKEFAMGFCQRWTATHITFHETIAEGYQVVLLWSFYGRRVDTQQEHRWGGLTLIRFDETGKIIAEIGEESTPGPFALWSEGRLNDETNDE